MPTNRLTTAQECAEMRKVCAEGTAISPKNALALLDSYEAVVRLLRHDTDRKHTAAVRRGGVMSADERFMSHHYGDSGYVPPKKKEKHKMTRVLVDHVVPGDSANHQLHVGVIDEPGQGGACHVYRVLGLDLAKNPAYLDKGIAYDGPEDAAWIVFQNGPIKEVGVNGVTHEALLAVLIDRMRSFQDGPYKCRENAIALTHLEDALMWLQRRTVTRIRRGVEGTHAI